MTPWGTGACLLIAGLLGTRLILASTGPATNRPPGQVCAMAVCLRTGAGRYQAYTLEGDRDR